MPKFLFDSTDHQGGAALTRRQTLAAAVGLAALAGRPAWAATGLPFKMFDCHAHFVSADTVRFPLYGVTPTPPGTPLPAALGGTNFPQPPPTETTDQRLHAHPTTAEKMFAWWDANGVDGGCGVQYRTAYGTHNDYLLSVADANPRVRPVVILDATDAATPAALSDMAHAHGACGIRITGPVGDTTWLDSPAARRTWAMANSLGLAVVIMYQPTHTSPDALNKIAVLAADYPNVRIALDHIGWPTAMGGPSYGLLPEHFALATHRNVFFKFTTMNLNALDANHVPTTEFLSYAVGALGSGRILWGSDVGNSPGPYEAMVQRVIASTAKLTPTEQRLVLGDTGRKVFVRGGRGAA